MNESHNSSTISNYFGSLDASAIDYVKKMLKSRIFLGRYIERRLVDQCIGYRDIVKLSPAEVELQRDLMEAQHKLQTVYQNAHWIGITDSKEVDQGSGVCLWTEIDNHPLGLYWFQIRSVKVRDMEIILILRCIRQITDAFLEVEPLLLGLIEKPTIEAKLNNTANEIVFNLKDIFTISNVRDFITFLCAFVLTIFTGSSSFVHFFGNFILSLIREISNLLTKSTPIILGFLDFLSKIVGGFYILIAMIFKPSNPGPSNKRSIVYNRHQEIYNNREFD